LRRVPLASPAMQRRGAPTRGGPTLLQNQNEVRVNPTLQQNRKETEENEGNPNGAGPKSRYTGWKQRNANPNGVSTLLKHNRETAETYETELAEPIRKPRRNQEKNQRQNAVVTQGLLPLVAVLGFEFSCARVYILRIVIE